MKKFFAAIMAALTILLVGGISAPASANAATVQTTTASVNVSKAAPSVGVTKAVPKNIGGGVVKPLYYWLDSSYCYWSGISYRSYYCYRYGCTYFERVAWGCYDGYVRITTYVYA